MIVRPINSPIGAWICIIPGVGIIFIMQPAIIGLHLPDQTGDIILDASPGGSCVRRILIGQWDTITVQFGKTEPGMTIRVIIMGNIPSIGTVLGSA